MYSTGLSAAFRMLHKAKTDKPVSPFYVGCIYYISLYLTYRNKELDDYKRRKENSSR